MLEGCSGTMPTDKGMFRGRELGRNKVGTGRKEYKRGQKGV